MKPKAGSSLREIKGLRPTNWIGLPDEGQTLILAPAWGKPPKKEDEKTWGKRGRSSVAPMAACAFIANIAKPLW